MKTLGHKAREVLVYVVLTALLVLAILSPFIFITKDTHKSSSSSTTKTTSLSTNIGFQVYTAMDTLIGESAVGDSTSFCKTVLPSYLNEVRAKVGAQTCTTLAGHLFLAMQSGATFSYVEYVTSPDKTVARLLVKLTEGKTTTYLTYQFTNVKGTWRFSGIFTVPASAVHTA